MRDLPPSPRLERLRERIRNNGRGVIQRGILAIHRAIAVKVQR